MGRIRSMARPDIAGVLSGLKDFQRRSVDYVFRRMYLDAEPATRFLVADEVGLGKTLVARGIIAKVIDRLWDEKKSINVVYICSNSDIARQNIQRLNVFEDTESVLPTRLTLMPSQTRKLRGNKLNFISFTPGTSFDLKNRTGWMPERVLLYWLLKPIWGFGGLVSPKNVFQATAKPESFRELIARFDPSAIDPRLNAEFRKALKDDNRLCLEEGRPTLKRRFDAACRAIPRTRRWGSFPQDFRREVGALIGELRALLAATCIRSLGPDLIILDEFQRFKNLLEGDDEAGALATKLFEWKEARVLLLSATPYKMYTNTHDDDDHYRDFLSTIRFLLQEEQAFARLDHLLKEYRRQLYRLAEDQSCSGLVEVKRELEACLRGFMVRTERLAASADRNGMLTERSQTTPISDSDLKAYLGLYEIIRWLDEDKGDDRIGSQMELWKSAPYLLNFMERDDYKLKRTLRDAKDDVRKGTLRARGLAGSVSLASDTLLDWRLVDTYGRLDPKNARLRSLIDEVLGDAGCEPWKLLWVPPSAPYHRLMGPFANPTLGRFTKRLIFSNWRVVPKAISTILSYEVERRMFDSLTDPERRYSNPMTRKSRLIEFARSQGRLTGMPVLGLIYPCMVFATDCDPMRLGAPWFARGALPSTEELLAVVKDRLASELSGMREAARPSDLPDHDWYWAAPILLDARRYPEATGDWFDQTALASEWKGEKENNPDEAEDTAWEDHVERARQVAGGLHDLGRPPDDLLDILAELAVAGPATVALRAFSRVFDDPRSIRDGRARSLAGSVGWSVRRLFKVPEVTSMIRGMSPGGEEIYWRQILRYCLEGCLQSVLDEHVHLLHEAENLTGKEDGDKAERFAAIMRVVIGLRASQPHIDEIATEDGRVRIEQRPMRARFALLFGESRSEEEGVRQRRENLRAAFNSPFYPFVLATTSVGQEGLDFHHYCHAVVHWNLPSNPVDLEQREGRVHRYKGHAVRKNVVARNFRVVGQGESTDPWKAMFDAAHATREQGSDLVPYWIYPLEGGAFIERHVPLLPFSKDRQILPELRRALTLYRMVFGQPRQDDLIEYLTLRLPAEVLARDLPDLSIDLIPPQA